jgi:hypothetical protein
MIKKGHSTYVKVHAQYAVKVNSCDGSSRSVLDNFNPKLYVMINAKISYAWSPPQTTFVK